MVFVAGLAICVVACSHYSTSGGLIFGIRTVAIPTAENDTPEIDIAQRLSDRATDTFMEDGRLRVVDEESSDALLLLTLLHLEDEPFTFTAQEVTEQYRFRLFVAATLERISDESALLELEQISGWGIYDAAQPDDAENGRDQAVDAAMDMLIEEIVDRTTTSW